MVKIVDVAREAGVSKSTVSRVLNDDKSVKESTRVAVKQAIEKLNYTPSYFAQGIRTRKTKTIAMLVPEYSNYFYSEMFRGVEDIALMNQYMVLVCSTMRHHKSELEYIQELLNRNVDGIIYNTYKQPSEETLEYMKTISEDVAIVLMNPYLTNDSRFSYVYTDGLASTRKAVRYLAGRGHRSIGYVRNAPSIDITNDRYEGYLLGMQDCGLPVEESYLYQVNPRDDEPDYVSLGREVGRQILGSPQRPTAILTAIDMFAIGCIKEFRQAGLCVPEEISVVGFDNVSLCEMIEPELTTIAQPTRKMGQKAAEIVISKIMGRSADNTFVFDGELIVRKSTK